MDKKDRRVCVVWMILITVVWLLAMSIADIKCCRVPVWMIAVGVGFAAVAGVSRCIVGEGEYSALMYGMLPGALLLVAALLTGMVGYADGLVLGCLGLVSGMEAGILALVFGLVLAAVYSVVLLMMGKVKRKSQIPFLPFLSVAWVVTGVV